VNVRQLKSAFFASALVFAACDSREKAAPAADTGAAAGKPDIVVREKMFLAQVNDIYLNQEDYIGKTIELEGLFIKEKYNAKEYCYVIRYGPGCCGSDGNAGFEVIWDQAEKIYPKNDDWVKASGTLATFDDEGYAMLYISLSALTVLEKRGAEFVSQ
jgi:uncharacterized membrane protein YcgQ (UPF0703/DUF1980 family)